MKKNSLITFFFASLLIGVFIVITYDITLAEENVQKVKLQVPFPGVDEIIVCQTSNGVSECNGIANYTNLAYQWTVGFALILSVLLLTYAGLVWMTARGDKGQIQKAQGIIKNTLVGLILAVGSYLILSLINPNLLTLQSLFLGKKIEKIGLEIEQQESAMETALDKEAVAGGGTPLNGGGEIGQLRSQGLLRTQCVGPGSCSGQKSGEWDRGLQGGGSNPVDPRIRGALEFVAKTCGPITITGLNEKSGHSGSSKHYRGQAVDIGGAICGADPDTCTDRQLQLVASLRRLGYGVGTPGGRCGGFKDGPGHFHIQVQ